MPPGTPGAQPSGVKGGLVGEMRLMARNLGERVPRALTRAVKFGLWQEGKDFKKTFREAVNQRFRIPRSKVGNLFSVYTAGERLGDVHLGVFTIWDAARVYEEGGTIQGVKWMLIPVQTRAYTPGGRIKKEWRDPATGKFAPDKLEGLFPIKARRNVVLLAKNVTTGRGKNKATKPEIWFVAIRVTRRSPTLRFFADFEAYFMRANPHLERAIEKGLQAVFAHE